MFTANYARFKISNSKFRSNFGRVASNYLSMIFSEAAVVASTFDNRLNPSEVS